MNDQNSPTRAKMFSPFRHALDWLFEKFRYAWGWLFEKPERLTAVSTCVIAFATVVALGISTAQWGALRRQLHLTETEQRPWVEIEKIEPAINSIDEGGLRFFHGQNSPGVLHLHMLLKNVGRSPAFNVRVGITPFFGYAQKIDKLGEDQEKNCAALDNAFPQTPAMVDNPTIPIPIVFPKEEIPIDSLVVGMLPEQIEKFSTGDTPANRAFQLWFYGCVHYNFANSNQRHKTSFAYRVLHIVDDQGARDFTFRPWEDIPANRIVIEPRPMTSGTTD